MKEPSNVEEEVKNLLPKVIAKKIATRVPPGFFMSQIKFTGEISGQPFGIGIKGSVEVSFDRISKTI